jgi:hypothetical protein
VTDKQQVPGEGCVSFTWALEARPPADALEPLLRLAAEALQLEQLDVSAVGPGKGCVASFSVRDAHTNVTVIAGLDGARLWIASWEDAKEGDPAEAPIEGLIQQVRSTIAAILRAEPKVQDARWMTFKEWAAIGKKRDPK